MLRACFVLALLPAFHSAAAPASPVPFRTVDRGQQTPIEHTRTVVVRTAAEWAALWKEHAPERPRPAVDFTRSTIVGVFLGTRPTAGYAVEIAGVTRDDAGLLVSYRERRPDPGDVAADMITMPYHLVEVARFSGPVRFLRAQ